MTDEASSLSPAGGAPPQRPPSRKLSLPSRVRGSVRRAMDRVLGADTAWSAAFVGIVVLLLASQRCAPASARLTVGQIAPHDIKSPVDHEWIDAALTEERRRHARESVEDVYVHDRDRGMRLARRLASVFEQGRTALEQPALGGNAGGQGVRQLANSIPAPALRTLLERRFDPFLERELSSALTQVMAGWVVGNRALLEREPAILLMHLPGNQVERVMSYDEFIDLEQARAHLRTVLAERLLLPVRAEQALAELSASFVDANVYYDPEATYERRQDAARAVPPVLVRVARGDILARKGDVVTPEVLERIEGANRASSQRLGWPELFGLLFLASGFAFFIHRYSRYHQRGFRKLRHLHSLMLLMLMAMLLLSKAILWLAGKAVDGLPAPFNLLDSYTYLIPLGGGAILIALLANGRIATVYSAFAALLFGALNGWDASLIFWAMIVQCVGVYAISTYRERSALLRAGLVVGGAGAAAVLALETLRGPLEPLSRSLYGAAMAFLGGAVGVGLLISFSLPLLEKLYNVLTDIRLLELSNVNNPLLSELAVRAPGSYNHSLVVGTLAEEGAKAIGANSLLCRVAAFFHDVGKMNKADYYVENQRGVNPHERLSPSMSALIIASHVKDGIRMAREAGLPEQIVDFIPQHHGTKLMTYFYEKAKNHSDPSLGPVNKEEFRYPGPKPQSREAAIFMLADAVEAAARTVEDPTANRLQEMIRKITNAIVLDGQFDSCDLTFADLEKIQEAFLRCLVSMYHHRLDYPGFDFGRPRSEPKVRPRAEDHASGEFSDERVARGS